MTLAFEDRKYFTKMSPSKCEHFNKGFCKQKSQYEKLHPSTNCDKQCVNQNLCPHRHRKNSILFRV